MFHSRNAKKVTAIEANTRAFLKCLCIKEILDLHRVKFELGDFISFLEANNSKYDMIFASGVLYHMEEPIKLLDLISKATDRLFIWTHYYDQEIILSRKELQPKFSPLLSLKHNGISYEYAVQSYKDALNWSGFCGGSEPTSKWLTRNSIIKALEQFGFTSIQYSFEQISHQNGPAFALCAKKGNV